MTKRKIIYGLASVIMVGTFLLYIFPILLLDRACGQASCVTLRLVVCEGIASTNGLCTGGGTCENAYGIGSWIQLAPLQRFSRPECTSNYCHHDRTFYVGLCMDK